MFYRYTASKTTSNSGFSILEVLITAAIIGVITGIIVLKYGSFNNSVLLKNQAFEIALDLREVQASAVSVRGEEAQFREEYGIYFSLAEPHYYQYFLDNGNVVENGLIKVYYDDGEAIGPPTQIDARFEIKRICINVTSSNDCPREVDDLSVSYKRPDFDSRFASVDARSQGVGAIDNARIEISGASGGTEEVKTVVIISTGQVSVE